MSDSPTSPTRRTALYGRHLDLGAKLADFGGWEMPIEYAGGGVLAEHRAVRERVGLFDVSHLGKVSLRGAGAAGLVDGTLTNALGRVGAGQAQYTLCCDADTGGVVDDLIVYFRDDSDLLLIPNAANSAEVTRRLLAEDSGVTVTDLHEQVAVLAVQGPRHREVLAALALPVPQRPMQFLDAEWSGHPVTVCRTGYTGEPGVELLIEEPGALRLWDAALAEVTRCEGLPCGLGARDTLRTEMGYPLHGHELSLGITPVQARLGWAVGWDKPAFWGRTALLAERERGADRLAWGLSADGRGVPRADLAVRSTAGAELGRTTSGTFSPTLGRGIALALLDRSVAQGDQVVVDVRGRELPCTVTRPPFVASRPG